MNRAGKKRHITFLYRFLLSYIIVFAIPLLCLSFYTFNHLFSIFSDELSNYQLNRLARIRDTLDMELRSMTDISIRLGTTDRLDLYFICTK